MNRKRQKTATNVYPDLPFEFRTSNEGVASLQVLGSRKKDPVSLPTSGILAADQAPQAFNNGTDAGEGALIVIDQPSGLLQGPITVPKQYAQQLGGVSGDALSPRQIEAPTAMRWLK